MQWIVNPFFMGEGWMYRKEMIELLKEGHATVSDLARRFECDKKDIEEDLEHIRKTLRKEGMTLKITPAVCKKCGFNFSKDKVGKPSKCPKCRSTWIAEPSFRIV